MPASDTACPKCGKPLTCNSWGCDVGGYYFGWSCPDRCAGCKVIDQPTTRAGIIAVAFGGAEPFATNPVPPTDGIAATIERVRRLDAAGTKGPWTADWAGTGHYELHAAGDYFLCGPDYGFKRGEDLDLIAAYRADAPALAAECERLRERVAMLEAWLKPFAEYGAVCPGRVDGRATPSPWTWFSETGSPSNPTVDDCRRAAALLTPSEARP